MAVTAEDVPVGIHDVLVSLLTLPAQDVATIKAACEERLRVEEKSNTILTDEQRLFYSALLDVLRDNHYPNIREEDKRSCRLIRGIRLSHLREAADSCAAVADQVCVSSGSRAFRYRFYVLVISAAFKQLAADRSKRRKLKKALEQALERVEDDHTRTVLLRCRSYLTGTGRRPTVNEILEALQSPWSVLEEAFPGYSPSMLRWALGRRNKSNEVA